MPVRPLLQADLPAAASFAERARARDPLIEPFATSLPALWKSERARRDLFLLAEEKGQACGVSFALMREPGQLELYAAVDPRERRRGVGKALLKPVLEVALREKLSLRASTRSLAAGGGFLTAHRFEPDSRALLLERSATPPPLPPATIRSLDLRTEGDRELLLSLSAGAYAEAPGNIRWSASDLARFDASSSVVLVAEHEGAPAAYLASREVGEALAIEEMGTLPAARRKGLARALIASALRRTSARAAVAWVDAANTAAVALYRALDFREKGARATYVRAAAKPKKEPAPIVTPA